MQKERKDMPGVDALLGLPSGSQMAEDLSGISMFDKAALIHFDINRFSMVNEVYGWGAGDALLLQLRDWILSTLRPTSRLYRVDGDEFCLLIREITLEEAKRRAEEILHRFTQAWALPFGGGEHFVYCSIKLGIVYGKTVQGDIRSLLHRTIYADDRLGLGYILYDEDMDRQRQKKIRLQQTLIDCVQRGMQGFSVCYQPIVDAKSAQWVGAEALCRWQTPEGERVAPLTFIPAAEQLGLIDKIDEWVRETTLRQCHAWKLTQKNFFLDLNLSPTQAISASFIERFLCQLDDIGYPKDKLNLEITESAKVDFSGSNLAGLRKLREAGIILSLDDFGTGYSSFDNLIHIPASALKTERAFIINLEENHYLQYLVQMLTNLAHEVGMKLIAEGVETKGQMALLQSFGVDYMQGYLFSKPLEAAQFEERLDEFV